MTVKIFENGQLINRIVADEDFAKIYCARHGYTYEIELPPPEPEPEDTYTADDLFVALLGGRKEEIL